MNKDIMSDRVAILLALSEERAQPVPNEAVLQACESALRCMPDLKEHVALHIEMSQPRE